MFLSLSILLIMSKAASYFALASVNSPWERYNSAWLKKDLICRLISIHDPVLLGEPSGRFLSDPAAKDWRSA